ncbi:MAG TPA: hypothetical protein VK188_12765 [Holophaga sp.]|nr:hypothetical protein [Holophaga sp.]
MVKRLGRWAIPLAAGAAFLVALGLLALLFYRREEAGLALLFELGFKSPEVKRFGTMFALRLVLPFYMVSGLFLWLATLGAGTAFKRGWSDSWRIRDGFLLTLSALLWAHAVLWWEVPATLWVLPGIRMLPFWLIYPLLALATWAYPCAWLRRSGLGWTRGTALAGLWLVLWSAPALLPNRIPRVLSPAKTGNQATKVLIIGLDGLRQDVGSRATAAWPGVAYDNAYTVIPATRLLWHILWGGDPLFYTVGHAPPALAEMQGAQPLPLIDLADGKGWKPRFYIDDGGTIGLTGRPTSFDDVLMPAPGWENFVNSNISVSFPLFAAWENWGRAFPTTNAWAPLDGGLKEALRLGQGSGLVMFHSCLAHVPIYLRRDEVRQLPSWWTLHPRGLQPYVALGQVTPRRLAKYDPRADPFTAYTIRMNSILRAWEPLWRGLEKDPQYKDAVRILFSDHGERFYHATPNVRLTGVHGYDLNPWEVRIMMKVDGPGFQAPAGAPPRKETVSVLSMRDALAEAIRTGRPFSRQTLETSHPQAPLRYHALSTELFTQEPQDLYRNLQVGELAIRTALGPNGVWATLYEKSPEERAKDVSLAWGRGDELEAIKPLTKGGARRFLYRGYELQGYQDISEAEYERRREEMNRALAQDQERMKP